MCKNQLSAKKNCVQGSPRACQLPSQTPTSYCVMEPPSSGGLITHRSPASHVPYRPYTPPQLSFFCLAHTEQQPHIPGTTAPTHCFGSSHLDSSQGKHNSARPLLASSSSSASCEINTQFRRTCILKVRNDDEETMGEERKKQKRKNVNPTKLSPWLQGIRDAESPSEKACEQWL